MTLQRWDPFRETLSLRDAMSRLLEDSFVRPTTSGMNAAFGPALDLQESQAEYTVRASLPGFSPEDVNVSVTGDTLKIQAEHKGEQEQKGKNYLVRERHVGSFARAIQLPTRVQAESAHARYENGELILTLPKAEDVKPKQIQIGVNGQQQRLEAGPATVGDQQQEAAQQ